MPPPFLGKQRNRCTDTEAHVSGSYQPIALKVACKDSDRREEPQ